MLRIVDLITSINLKAARFTLPSSPNPFSQWEKGKSGSPLPLGEGLGVRGKSRGYLIHDPYSTQYYPFTLQAFSFPVEGSMPASPVFAFS
jgi:hypothetical protein